MFNCQTKRTIVALFIYPEIPPCRVFFFLGGGGPGDRIFVCLRNCVIAQIPAQSPFFNAQFAFQNPHNFLFFSCTLSEGLIIKLANASWRKIYLGIKRKNFTSQTSIRYNSVFSRLLHQNQAFQSQNEAKASTPCKNTHSQKWLRAERFVSLVEELKSYFPGFFLNT